METVPVKTSDPLAAADAEPLSDSRQTVSTTMMAAAVLQALSTIPLHDDSIGNVANPLSCMIVVDKLHLPIIIVGLFSFLSPTHSASDKETKDADGVKCSSLASSSLSSSSSLSMLVSSLPDLGEPPNTTTTTTKACATTTTASKNKRTTVKPATKRSKKASMTTLTTTTRTTTTTSTATLEPNNLHQCRYKPDIPMSKEELKQWQLQACRMRNCKSAAASWQKPDNALSKWKSNDRETTKNTVCCSLLEETRSTT
ncbi:hypothetical protein ACA910_002545 [Epithemia clementina (nom. ined.)]